MAIVFSVPILGLTVAAFASGNWGWGIVGILALWAVWWIAGSMHNRGLVAQGIRGEVGTRALDRLPEWRSAILGKDYRLAANVSRAMVKVARGSRKYEGDSTTLGHLLNLHIGTLHLADEYDEKYAAVEEIMTLLQPGEEEKLTMALSQMFNEGDDLLAYHLVEASRVLFPHTT